MPRHTMPLCGGLTEALDGHCRWDVPPAQEQRGNAVPAAGMTVKTTSACVPARSGTGVAGMARGTALVRRIHAQGCSVPAELLLRTSCGYAPSSPLKRCCLDLFAEYGSICCCVPCLERGPLKGEMDGTEAARNGDGAEQRTPADGSAQPRHRLRQRAKRATDSRNERNCLRALPGVKGVRRSRGSLRSRAWVGGTPRPGSSGRSPGAVPTLGTEPAEPRDAPAAPRYPPAPGLRALQPPPKAAPDSAVNEGAGQPLLLPGLPGCCSRFGDAESIFPKTEAASLTSLKSAVHAARDIKKIGLGSSKHVGVMDWKCLGLVSDFKDFCLQS